MPGSADDHVIDFFQGLFSALFYAPVSGEIDSRLRRNEVCRRVEEAADAASQSLTRFFLNRTLSEQEVADVLAGFARLAELLDREEIANPNVSPESVVERVLQGIPSPAPVAAAGREAVYRVALHSVVQVLMLVAPVMAEWRKLKFSKTFELPRRVTNRLNEISRQLGVFGLSGQTAADEQYELDYRDYLLQRFHRVEAGTVRMTTSLIIDLRELFVMPNVRTHPLSLPSLGEDSLDGQLMDLSAARKFFRTEREEGEVEGSERGDADWRITALDQLKRYPRNVIVGAPGVGKSTLLDWLQLRIAAVEEEFVLADQQAIPLLLRVRQLDPENLPRGAALIERATASRDRATLMPDGWIDRQMRAGRVLFMLDGLDETEPELRDQYVIPWVISLCRDYPQCHYLISSRPAGYPPGLLRELEFVACDLLDFEEGQIREYTKHWCTAVRLARNEPDEEARREGEAEGAKIVDGFKDHPYIPNLARNPLMLSAICLVNYFEGGHLPEDRAKLYQLCVEGLLHYWDHRRGIRSEFGLDEKLRVCRELALAMQADDRAEYAEPKVVELFTEVLGDVERAEALLKHIRFRTGLVVERRPEVFAFAHLTFQEYLAARAVHEGKRLGIDAKHLGDHHADGRWEEVIALYCGLSISRASRDLVELLVAQPDTLSLAPVLAGAYLASGPELLGDEALRHRVLTRIASAPHDKSRGEETPLEGFPSQEVTRVANACVGRIESDLQPSVALRFLERHPALVDVSALAQRLKNWPEMRPTQLAELFILVHRFGSDRLLSELATWPDVYAAGCPKFGNARFGSQAEIALLGLSSRDQWRAKKGIEAVLCRIIRGLLSTGLLNPATPPQLCVLFERLFGGESFARVAGYRPEVAGCTTVLGRKLRNMRLTETTLSRKTRERIVRDCASQLQEWGVRLAR